DEGFLFSSSVLAVGLVVLVAMIAASVIFWGMGVGPVSKGWRTAAGEVSIFPANGTAHSKGPPRGVAQIAV
ncbi:hypothetical protein R0G64_31995, partial [Pseudomonas otitidis]|nr:hypothetical protein [Pseudomonas otitidis]